MVNVTSVCAGERNRLFQKEVIPILQTIPIDLT